MWTLAGSQAQFESSLQRLKVDFDRPETGISNAAFAGSQFPTGENHGGEDDELRLLSVINLRCQLSEAYVRGQEAVAAYRPLTDQRVFYRLVWKILPADTVGKLPVGGVELAISAHTDRLDSEPQLEVQSRLPAGSCKSSDGWFLHHLDGLGTPYLEVVHPSNYRDSATQTKGENGYQTAHHFFPGHLEKGVICVARMRSFLVSASDFTSTDAEQALACLIKSPPPLD